MTASPSLKDALRRVADGLRRDRFFQLLLAGLLVLSLLSSTPVTDYPALVDTATLAALTGLLLLTKGLELSGILHRLGHRLVSAMPSERAVALALVSAAAALSTVLTNDVALFVVVPLTLGVARIAALPVTKLIVFEALAVNVGSALTPIGNPQNLFLWQVSQVSFGSFVAHQAPLVGVLMLLLLATTALAFPGRAMHVAPEGAAPTDRRLLTLSLALYGPFLIATDHGHAAAALGVLLLLFALLKPRALLDLDWGLLLVFVLMFIDLRLLAQLPAVKSAMLALDLAQPLNLYLVSIGASQLISNVPAAIALAEYSGDWRVMAWGVNVGGFGFMVGSLANLIALRMSGDARAWRVFHVYAIPALVVATLVGWVLMGLPAR